MYNLQYIYIHMYTVIPFMCFERQTTSWSCKWCWINFNNNHLVQVRQGICQKLLVILHAEVCSNHHIPTSQLATSCTVSNSNSSSRKGRVYFAKPFLKRSGSKNAPSTWNQEKKHASLFVHIAHLTSYIQVYQANLWNPPLSASCGMDLRVLDNDFWWFATIGLKILF